MLLTPGKIEAAPLDGWEDCILPQDGIGSCQYVLQNHDEDAGRMKEMICSQLEHGLAEC